MISSNDFRPGVSIDLDGDAYVVVDFQHVKPGKGAAFVRTKLKNLRTGGVIEVPKAHLDRRNMQYLYSEDDDSYIFMDEETFEQQSLNKEQLGAEVKYLKENMVLSVLFYQGNIIGVDFPAQVELTVVETEPGIKGDTASGGTKPATMDTGAVVRVPFFINEGDVLRINTRTGEYIERV